MSRSLAFMIPAALALSAASCGSEAEPWDGYETEGIPDATDIPAEPDTSLDPAPDTDADIPDVPPDEVADPPVEPACSDTACGPHGHCEGDACVCDDGYVQVGDACLDPDAPGHITVRVNDVIYFDRETTRSLLARSLHYTTEQYRDGPPGAAFTVVDEDVEAGHLEVLATGMDDDHGNCEEKWGFIFLEGDCSNVWLEKWNWNPCNVEYQTDRMKLETWIDQNGDCTYESSENDEPYSDAGIRWSTGEEYRIVFDWE